MIKYILLVLLTVTLSSSGKTYGDVRAYVISVYDGDTITVYIEGWPKIIETISVRLSGIDAPEMKGKCREEIEGAIRAREFVYNYVMEGRVVELRNMKRDKYFRILADVYVDNVNLSQKLMDNGLAIAYDGNKKENWCEILRGK